MGKVFEINWRSVKIHSRFNEEIVIPNNMLGKEKIKNLSSPSRVYAELLKFGFSYNDSPEKVKRVLLDVATQNDRALKTPAPVVLTLSYDDFAITYGLKLFIKDYEDVFMLNDEIMSSLYTATEENGLTIPFPRQELDVNLKKD